MEIVDQILAPLGGIAGAVSLLWLVFKEIAERTENKKDDAIVAFFLKLFGNKRNTNGE